ncbi:(2Fe-2S) ferredoxin domain-containing protein [Desertibacillus haloalkaliphilus]|uniref:(2Fe-2S) ferredoxin domain-containing protein n=1 Tax=Desertibacillus haloalkaliphilus TaxID=1328930 RepID=UPI001C26D510|nr:(2Fe-2S) ferredoxin domain-containing protein [Desertibacillus haloalkaliphilus]MBU8906199.1 (2Fe-2S) ferredoxin domain-containing protein [Desertibacillus haloalkaliphilus]
MASWNLANTQHHLLICNGSSCKKEGAEELTQSIRDEIMAKDLDSYIHTSRTLCNGRCQDKCVLISYPDGHWYKEMTSDDAPRFIDSLMNGNTIADRISHTYNGKGFVRSEGTPAGKEKNAELVKKVSKNL